MAIGLALLAGCGTLGSKSRADAQSASVQPKTYYLCIFEQEILLKNGTVHEAPRRDLPRGFGVERMTNACFPVLRDHMAQAGYSEIKSSEAAEVKLCLSPDYAYSPPMRIDDEWVAEEARWEGWFRFYQNGRFANYAISTPDDLESRLNKLMPLID